VLTSGGGSGCGLHICSQSVIGSIKSYYYNQTLKAIIHIKSWGGG